MNADGLTVDELIAALKGVDGNLKVYIESDKTILKAKSVIEERYLHGNSLKSEDWGHKIVISI